VIDMKIDSVNLVMKNKTGKGFRVTDVSMK